MLTAPQAACLEAIRQFWRDYGCGPSYHDLMEVLGYRSPNSIKVLLKSLLKQGLVEVNPNTARQVWPAGWKAKICKLLGGTS